MNQELRAYAWTQFAAAAYSGHFNSSRAATEADGLLKELDKRFNKDMCPHCQGDGCATCKERGRIDR